MGRNQSQRSYHTVTRGTLLQMCFFHINAYMFIVQLFHDTPLVTNYTFATDMVHFRTNYMKYITLINHYRNAMDFLSLIYYIR